MRFKAYTYDWSKYCCSDFLKSYSTNSLSWDKLSYEDSDGVLNLHYGLIHNGAPTLIDTASYNLPKIIEDMPKSYELCKNGDVIFADASEDTNDICKPVEILKANGKSIVSGLHTIHTRDYKDLTCVGFKGYLFSSKSFHKQVFRLTQGTKIFSISFNNFREMSVSIPQKEEQRKIVAFLSQIDERIETQSKIIEKLKSQIILISNIMVKAISQKISLGEICIFERKTAHQSSEGLSNGSYPFFTNEEETVKFFNSYDFNGEYIIANTGGKANFKYYNGKFAAMSDCLIIKIKDASLTKFYSIVFSNLQKYIDYVGFEGSGLKHLNKDWLLKLQVPQYGKEAEIFIKMIDNLKEKLQKEKDILSLYKKQKAYLLSNMFI